VKATLVETFSWIDYASVRGFILHENDVQLPGMIVIDMANVHDTLDSAIQEYKFRYTLTEKINNEIVLHSGPRTIFDADEVRKAILDELSI